MQYSAIRKDIRIRKEPEHNVITSASQSAAGAIVCSVVFTVNLPLHLLVSIVQSFCPLPLKLTTYKLYNSSWPIKLLISIFWNPSSPSIIYHHQGFSHLSLSSATNVHLWLYASEIQFITVITITFWKEEAGFIIQNIALLIKIDNDEAVFCHLQMW